MKPLNIEQLFAGCSKIMDNARELVEEAELLLTNSRYARAFALGHLASEELMKYPALLAIASELARGHDVDWRTVDKRLRDHIVKTRGSILVDYMSQPPQDGVHQVDELGSQLSAAESINNLKNQSLYVSQVGGEFLKPSELVTLSLATDCVSEARRLFQIAQMSYSTWSTLTGMTEEGLRSWVRTPVFEEFYQALGSATDLSHFPLFSKQQALEEMVGLFNSSTFIKPIIDQFPGAVEDLLRSFTQAENRNMPPAANAGPKEPAKALR